MSDRCGRCGKTLMVTGALPGGLMTAEGVQIDKETAYCDGCYEQWREETGDPIPPQLKGLSSVELLEKLILSWSPYCGNQ